MNRCISVDTFRNDEIIIEVCVFSFLATAHIIFFC